MRAAQTAHAACLLRDLGQHTRLVEAIQAIAACIRVGCRIASRTARPSAFQFWLDSSLGGLT